MSDTPDLPPDPFVPNVAPYGVQLLDVVRLLIVGANRDQSNRRPDTTYRSGQDTVILSPAWLEVCPEVNQIQVAVDEDLRGAAGTAAWLEYATRLRVYADDDEDGVRILPAPPARYLLAAPHCRAVNTRDSHLSYPDTARLVELLGRVVTAYDI